MAATIHSLFAGNAEAPASLHPLLTELRDSSLKVLEELAIRMFDSADDALFEMGEKASNDGERRRYFDTMRVLRIDRNRVTREFSKQLAQGFINGGKSPLQSTTFDLDSLSIQPTEELEEKIALTNLAAKIEGMYKNQIWDVERRLEIVQMRGVPVSPQALNPSRICDAFGSAAAVLDTDFRVKLVVYKLFDRVLSRELERVYKAAIEVLDRHGFDGRKSFTAAPPSNPQPAIDQSQQAAMELLRQNGFDPNTLRRTSDPAAQELADTLQGMFKQGGLEGVQASTQRLSMAGRMFNDLLSEPLLNDSLRSTLEPLRYPVYRTALADPTFFTSPSHPARKILGDLIELAAATQTGEISQTRFRALVQSAIAQAEGAAANPAQLNNLGTAGQALSGTELDGFIEQLREQSRSRRTTLLLHVRRLVSQELDLRTVGREVPKPVQTLLRSGIGPLMAVRLLKSGRGSPPFREAENLLERVLSSLEFKPPAQPSDLSLREQLLNDAVSVFKDIGMAEDKIEVLLNGLQDVYKTLDESEAADVPGLDELTAVERAHLLSDFSEELLPPAAPTAAPQPQPQPQPSEPELPKVTALELLSRILTPESWFRVFDPNQNQTRWLKLASFYANQDSVTFSGFDESTKLCLRGTRLADDLVKGHSEPINPTTSAREALDQLRRARELGLL